MLEWTVRRQRDIDKNIVRSECDSIIHISHEYDIELCLLFR